MQIYYCKDETQCGPVDVDHFTSLYADGAVDLNTMVWIETMTEWARFANSPIYPQIQAEICPVPPPPPPRPPSEPRSRESVRFVTENIDYRKSIRQRTSTRNASQRTASQRLTRSSLYDVSKNIWIEDPNEAWLLGSIIHQDNTLLAVQNLSTQEKFLVDTGFKDVYLANDKVVSDMSSLNYMHEPGLLFNLEQRFVASLPYTYMGLVLLAVNPLRYLPQPSPNEFIARSLNPELPHPYAIAGLAILTHSHSPRPLAELCCQALDLKNSQDQSIVISGESGAGAY
jgi:hypothetical protein